MKDLKLQALLDKKIVEAKNLKIALRRIPMMQDFFQGKKARDYISTINRMVYFYRYFETRIEINRGDVFNASFEYTCGNELHGPHYVVALFRSSPISQIVTIVPLHSAKEGKELNPASEIMLGEIPGVHNGKKAVAIINQIRTIDKRRLFDRAAIDHFNSMVQAQKIKDYHEINAQVKYIHRLTDEQYEKLHEAVKQFILFNYIKH